MLGTSAPSTVMIPLAASFREQANHGEFECAPLVAALAPNRIEIFDPGPAMIDASRVVPLASSL